MPATDDRAAALLLHDWDHMLHSQVAALEIGGKYPVPIVLRQFDDPADMGEADIVVQYVDLAVGIDARPDHPTDVVVAGHVGPDRRGYTLVFGNNACGLVRSVLVDVGAHHPRPFAGEECCCCLAVTPARPDRPGPHHQCHFVLQTPGHGLLQRVGA
jgi:hypothetical protein